MITKKRLLNGKVSITFSYHNPRAKRVDLVGDFNKWGSLPTPMQRISDGSWSATIEVEEGRAYGYRFLVDGMISNKDPEQDAERRDPKGNVCSQVTTLLIKTPYFRTPYEILSNPDDPEIGSFSTRASQDDVMGQRNKCYRKRKNFTEEHFQRIRDAVQELGFPDRVNVDVFLVSTLLEAGDLENFKQQADTPPKAALEAPDWKAGLTFWDMPPSEEIILDDLEVSRITTYDDPRGDLSAIDFDR